MLLYVIPDIHGHKAKLDHALDLVAALGGREASVVFLGDLVDRGPDSRGVIQTLIDGLAQGRDWTVLRGNHDQLFLDFIDAASTHSPLVRSGRGWLSPVMGGEQTLASYGVRSTEDAPNWDAAVRAVPAAHVDFLRALPYLHQTDDLILVHAGIRPGIALHDQDPDDLIWIRDDFLLDRRDHGKLVVHGHTPVDFPEHHGNRVALDGGAGWGRDLFVAVFDGRDCRLLTDDGGTVPLRLGRVP